MKRKHPHAEVFIIAVSIILWDFWSDGAGLIVLSEYSFPRRISRSQELRVEAELTISTLIPGLICYETLSWQLPLFLCINLFFLQWNLFSSDTSFLQLLSTSLLFVSRRICTSNTFVSFYNKFKWNGDPQHSLHANYQWKCIWKHM